MKKFEQPDIFDEGQEKDKEREILIPSVEEVECQYCGGYGDCDFCERGKEEKAENWKKLRNK